MPQHHVSVVTAEEGADLHHQTNFTPEEAEILTQEVQASNRGIYGPMSRPPRADDVKLAWDEVTNIINASPHNNPGIMIAAARCGKQ